MTWLNEWIEKYKVDLIIEDDRVISIRYDTFVLDEHRFMIITGLLRLTWFLGNDLKYKMVWDT